MTFLSKIKTVLIVEDNLINYTLLEKIFERIKVNVIWADDGLKAVSIFKDNTDIDFVVMDFMLPGLNGIEATKEIKKINPNIPVVAQTGFDDISDSEFSIFNGIIKKPFDYYKIKNLVNNILKMTNKEIITKSLLEINAVRLNVENPFIWASGIKSPIYCDNRKTLSFPEIRNRIKTAFVEIISEKYPETELIAGVATGGIALGVLVAQELNLPFAYVRSEPKNHGLENLVEGIVAENQKIVVIEDLISTGSSSLKAVDALRDRKCNVLGLLAIFSYNFDSAKQNFLNKNCDFDTITNYNTLINVALETNYITQPELELLVEWRKNPQMWKNGK